jgi:CO/xanthine dehydrogenase Mo-binding subunit
LTPSPGRIAKPEADGRITVHTNTQALYSSLDNTAIILQIEPSRLHFVGGTVGGGFGGKVDEAERAAGDDVARHASGRVGLLTREERVI